MNNQNSVHSHLMNGSHSAAKVVYWDGSEMLHSAIVTSSKKFTSKWGMSGLYEHSPKDCPYSQSDGTYKLTFYK